MITMNSSTSTITTDLLNQSIVRMDQTTEPSTLDLISSEILDYFERHPERIPLLVFVYALTIIWILYLILYNSRIQGILLSYILQRFYFKDTGQIRFDSLSISFISGSIMFRNLHYTTGSYFVFIRDGCLVFRYWSRTTKKPTVRLKIKLYHLDMQLFNPIRMNSTLENNNIEETQRGSITGYESTVMIIDEYSFVFFSLKKDFS